MNYHSIKDGFLTADRLISLMLVPHCVKDAIKCTVEIKAIFVVQNLRKKRPMK